MKASILGTIILFAVWSVVDSKKILLLPFMTPSHFLQLGSVGHGLIQKGHEVHMVVHESQKVPGNILKWGVKIIGFKSTSSAEGGDEVKLDDAEFQKGSVKAAESGNSMGFMIGVVQNIAKECVNMIDNPDLFSKLRKEKFDFAVVDGAPVGRCLFVIPYRLRLQYAAISPVMPFDNMALTLQVPFLNPLQSDTSFSIVSTFKQRLSAVIQLNVMPAVVRHYTDEDKLKATCEDKPFESLSALMMKSHIWLVDLDSLVDVPKHLPPNMVLVGGISTSPPLPLEKQLKVFADSATEGLVVMSFGGTLGYLPEDYVNRITLAVGKVKYKVIFRQKTKPTVKVPAHLKLVDWMPQNDLLAHPNTKVFVTHCGSNGQHEAVYHGVPMLGVPVVADQLYNADRHTARGYGTRVSIATVTPDELAAAIEEVATNPSYRANIQKASKIFRSRPMAPRERAAYWIEHVMEHGSDHLQAYTNQLAWYQIILLDVTSFLLFVTLTVSFVVFKCVKFICKRCTGTSGKQKVN